LFDNAIKYSPAETKVALTATNKKHSVTINITDQGVGIATADLAHIFDRFYRADKSRSQADGHGLGLSIVKKIVTVHSGSIDVSSIPHKHASNASGGGTTFTLTFPLIVS
jgi:signal transduction histidine kinase